MTTAVPHLNLVLAWAWILLGFLSGAILGTRFHREDWLGGYGSFARRLCRLGHISFFGLGTVNLFFYFTVRSVASSGPLTSLAAWAFLLGAVTMPACCFASACDRRFKALFPIPVASLLGGGLVFLWEIIKI